MNQGEVVEDFLEVDQPVPGQNYACLSFISNQKVLKKKEAFLCKHFLKYYMKELRRQDNPELLDPEKFTAEWVDRLNVDEIYDDYLYKNEEQLSQKFSELNDFQTSINGIKIRGTYDNRREADVRAKVLQRKDPNFHVFVGQVGYWLPWDPNPDNIKDQEYANDQLNTLMKKYVENRDHRDEMYAQETEDRKRKAREENRKREFYRNKTEHEEKDAKDNIDKLREIADEKDRLYENIFANNSQPNNETDESSTKLQSEAVNVGDANSFDDSKFADPWMERKSERGKNFDAGKSNTEITTEEKEKNLEKIINDIF